MLKNDFIFVSPHRDDVCFSLGVLAWLTGGVIVNVFTRSQYTVHTVDDLSSDTIDRVSALRRSEDSAFMAMSGLVELDLAWSEAPLRSHGPFDRAHLDPEIEAFGPQLHRALSRFARSKSYLKPWLFCPMAIGGHRDHLIVRNAVLDRLSDLENGFFVAFYEDLHYASKPDNREIGIADFLRCLGPHHFRRTALAVGRHADLKLKMVSLYTSQFRQLPQDLSEFTPALSGAEPHEAIWARREISRDWRVWFRKLGRLGQ